MICDNSDKIEDIQVYAMVLPDHEINPRVPCNSNLLPRIDLTRCQGIKTCILELEIFHIGIIISYARTKNIQIHSSYLLYLGTPSPSKIDGFSEKFQTAFDPPPSFLKNYVAKFFREISEKPCIEVEVAADDRS